MRRKNGGQPSEVPIEEKRRPFGFPGSHSGSCLWDLNQETSPHYFLVWDQKHYYQEGLGQRMGQEGPWGLPAWRGVQGGRGARGVVLVSVLGGWGYSSFSWDRGISPFSWEGTEAKRLGERIQHPLAYFLNRKLWFDHTDVGFLQQTWNFDFSRLFLVSQSLTFLAENFKWEKKKKRKSHWKPFFHHLPSSSCRVAIATLEICGHAGTTSQINVLFHDLLQQEQKRIAELQQKEEPQHFVPVHTTSCNTRPRNLTKHWAILQRFFGQCCPFNSTFVLVSGIPPVCRAD